MTPAHAQTSEAGADADALLPVVRTVDYLVVDQPVSTFLDMMSMDFGLRMDVSDNVTGRIRNMRLTGAPDDVLDKVSQKYALDWFEFNGIYYLSSRREALTRLVRLGRLSRTRAFAALSESGLMQTNFPVRMTADGSALALSGPPRFLAISEALLESVPDQHIAIRPERQIVIRRGNVMTNEAVTEGDS